MTRRAASYDLRIGTLVLEGVPAGNRAALVAALEGELGRLLGNSDAPFARGLPGRDRRRIAVDRLPASDLATPAGSPAALGTAAAQAIVSQLGTVSGGKHRP